MKNELNISLIWKVPKLWCRCAGSGESFWFDRNFANFLLWKLTNLMNESAFHFCGRWILTTTVFHFPKSTSAGGIPDFFRVWSLLFHKWQVKWKFFKLFAAFGELVNCIKIKHGFCLQNWIWGLYIGYMCYDSLKNIWNGTHSQGKQMKRFYKKNTWNYIDTNLLKCTNNFFKTKMCNKKSRNFWILKFECIWQNFFI
jgi:hypothetical protein